MQPFNRGVCGGRGGEGGSQCRHHPSYGSQVKHGSRRKKDSLDSSVAARGSHDDGDKASVGMEGGMEGWGDGGMEGWRDGRPSCSWSLHFEIKTAARH